MTSHNHATTARDLTDAERYILFSGRDLEDQDFPDFDGVAMEGDFHGASCFAYTDGEGFYRLELLTGSSRAVLVFPALRRMERLEGGRTLPQIISLLAGRCPVRFHARGTLLNRRLHPSRPKTLLVSSWRAELALDTPDLPRRMRGGWVPGSYSDRR